MTKPSADIFAVVVTESFGNLWAFTAPIGVLGTNQNSVGLGVVLNIVQVWPAPLIAVMGIQLMPLVVVVFGINVIAKGLLHTPSQSRSLAAEPQIVPVFIECHHLCDAHDVDNEPLAVPLLLPVPTTQSPIAAVCLILGLQVARVQMP